MSSDDSDSFSELLREVANAPPIDPKPRGLLPGETVGPYRIEAQLGKGGMGVVYRAFDTRIARHVAIKFWPRAGDDGQRLLTREARLAAAVKHPNIAGIFDIGMTETGAPYLVMELVEGLSLRQVIANGPSSTTFVISLARQLAAALAAAHGAGIIHRDLKPDNIVVDQHERLKILDFGIARATTDAHDAEAFVGTRGYVPPGQQRTSRPTSDIYAYGVTLLEVLTGIREVDQAKKHQRFRKAPRWLRELIVCATDVDAERRPKDGDALVERLNAGRRAQALRGLGLVAAVLIAGVAGLAALIPEPPKSAPVAAVSAGPKPVAYMPTRLTRHSGDTLIADFAVSPSGKYLAYVDERGLFVRQTAGRRPQRVPLDGAIGMLQWRSDTTLLVNLDPTGFGIRRGSDAALWRVDLPLSKLKATKLFGFDGYSVRMAPDGKHLLVASDRGVEIKPLKGTAATKSIYRSVKGQYLYAARWAPNGRRVVVAVGTASADRSIQIMSCDVRSLGGQDGTRAADGFPCSLIYENRRLLHKDGRVGFDFIDNDLVVALAPWPHVELESELRRLHLDSNSVVRQTTLVKAGLSSLSAIQVVGKAIAANAGTYQADVYTADVAPTGLTSIERMTKTDYDEYVSSWYGADVVFTSDREGGYQLYRQGPSQVEPLLKPDRAFRTWGRFDGKSLRYLRIKPTSDKKSVVSLVTPTHAWTLGQTVWPPTTGRPPPRKYSFRCLGDRCWIGEREGRGWKFYRADPAQRKAAVSYQGRGLTRAWSLSHDGDKVLIPDNRGIIELSLRDGHKVRRSAELDERFLQFVIPYGKGWIATTVDASPCCRYQILRLSRNGKVRVLHQTRSGWITHPVLSADAKRIAYSQTAFTTQIHLYKPQP